jgi:RHS repeat-associated protein
MGSRRLSRHYDGPDITTSYAYDGNRRITRLDHVVDGSNQRVRGFAYAWDRAGNRRFERRLTVNTTPAETGGPGEFYQYDSAYRLVHADRDVTSGNLDAVGTNTTTVTAPTPVASAASDFAYDPAGNRRNTLIDTTWQAYEMRRGVNEFDAAMNQYTSIGSSFRTHDRNGNVISSSETGSQRFFDANDQLVQWTDTTKDVRYRYDALGRRVSKRMAAGGSTWTLYFWDGWQVAEETTSAGVVERRYVYGEGIDEPLRATLKDVLDLDGDTSTTDMVDLHYHENSLGSIAALTKSDGSVVESYRYDAFGQVTVYDSGGSPVSTTQVQQPYTFTGRALDWEEGSGLYYYRLRYYDPEAGRFISRDPLGLWGDESQNGNGQSYCGNNPVNLVDPLGLGPIEEAWAEALIKLWEHYACRWAGSLRAASHSRPDRAIWSRHEASGGE